MTIKELHRVLIETNRGFQPRPCSSYCRNMKNACSFNRLTGCELTLPIQVPSHRGGLQPRPRFKIPGFPVKNQQ